MRRVALVVSMTWSLLMVTAEARLAAELKIDQWSYTAPIEIEQGKPGRAVEFALTPETLDVAKPDLSDLRIVADSGAELGYVLATKRGSDTKTPLTVTLFNRSYIPQTHSSVTADFGAKTAKDSIRIITTGTNFRRKVRIEGSDDGESWQVIRDNALLFRVQDKRDKEPAFDKSDIQIANNDFRRLRITVFNGADDPESVEIKDVKAWKLTSTPPETLNVPVVSSKVEEKDKEKATDILLDLGFRNLPLNELALDFSDGNFFRKVTVFGRNSETRVVRARTEDSPAGQKTVPVPWTRVAGGSLFRFSGQGATAESLSVKLGSAGFRYLRVQINNGDDPPLKFTGARVNRYVPRLTVTPVEAGRIALYFGNPNAGKPSYDVVHYVDRLRNEGVAEASIGRPVPNPSHKSVEKSAPWSERHRAIIWLALLAMAAVLGYLVYRMAVSAKKQAG